MYGTRRIVRFVKRLLSEPTMVGFDLDGAEATLRHRALIQTKPFLRRIYQEWYRLLSVEVPNAAGPILELGSGGGFFAEVHAGVIRSDILPIGNLDVQLDAGRLPFGDGTLQTIVMTNVFHHIPDGAGFLAEVVRCLKPNGQLTMIEPWVTPWSRWVFTRFHHEPFDPESRTWGVEPGRPLSCANGALPWIVFERDRKLLRDRFPALQVIETMPIMPLRYLVSGGMSVRALAPAWTFPLLRFVDDLLLRTVPATAMFARITVQRRPDSKR